MIPVEVADIPFEGVVTTQVIASTTSLVEVFYFHNGKAFYRSEYIYNYVIPRDRLGILALEYSGYEGASEMTRDRPEDGVAWDGGYGDWGRYGEWYGYVPNYDFMEYWTGERIDWNEFWMYGDTESGTWDDYEEYGNTESGTWNDYEQYGNTESGTWNDYETYGNAESGTWDDYEKYGNTESGTWNYFEKYGKAESGDLKNDGVYKKEETIDGKVGYASCIGQERHTREGVLYRNSAVDIMKKSQAQLKQRETGADNGDSTGDDCPGERMYRNEENNIWNDVRMLWNTGNGYEILGNTNWKKQGDSEMSLYRNVDDDISRNKRKYAIQNEKIEGTVGIRTEDENGNTGGRINQRGYRNEGGNEGRNVGLYCSGKCGQMENPMIKETIEIGKELVLYRTLVDGIMREGKKSLKQADIDVIADKKRAYTMRRNGGCEMIRDKNGSDLYSVNRGVSWNVDSWKWEGWSVESGKWEGSNVDTGKWEGSNMDSRKWEGSNVDTGKWEGSNVDTGKWEGSNLDTGKWEGSNMDTGKWEGSNVGTGKWEVGWNVDSGELDLDWDVDTGT